MDKKKSQSYNFCYDVLPSLFHTQTDQFMQLIDRDGLKFIKFWWDFVGVRLPDENLSPFKDVSFEVTPLNKKSKLILLTLPSPKETGEIYFVALISNPEKRFAWVRLPTTRIFALAKEKIEIHPSGTTLGDLTPRGIFVPIGEGPVPSKEAFMAAVQERIQSKPR